LWLPLPAMSNLIIIMALLGGLVTIVTVVHHRVTRRIGKPEIPYGVAIALAGLWVMGEPYFNPLA
jgi:prepilin peptidase CpaA